MLGLLVSPGRISMYHVTIAVLAGLLLTFVARPLSVLACAFTTRMSVREQVFISWAGLRGAVPIVLATIPLAENVPGAEQLFDIVFVMVVIYTLVTGPTLPWVAARLGVTQPGEPRDIDVDAAPLERIAADLLQVHITPQSQLHGVEVGELRLPVGASVALLVRDGHTLVPDQRTVLRRGDDMLVVTPRKAREATEQRLRAVSARGRLADWLGGSENA
jgi:cell volume regulation protein A